MDVERFFEGHLDREDIVARLVKVIPGFAEHRWRVSYLDKKKELPLHYAVRMGAPLEVLNVLVSSYPRALVETVNHERTPLHVACGRFERPDRDVIKLLASPEAVRAQDLSGSLAMHVICNRHHLFSLDLEVLRLLTSSFPESVCELSGRGQVPLHQVCQNGGQDKLLLVRCMVEMCPDSVKVLNGDGDTPLHAACRDGSIESLALLVEFLSQIYPAGVFIANSDGFTPLHIACKY